MAPVRSLMLAVRGGERACRPSSCQGAGLFVCMVEKALVKSPANPPRPPSTPVPDTTRVRQGERPEINAVLHERMQDARVHRVSVLAYVLEPPEHRSNMTGTGLFKEVPNGDVRIRSRSSLLKTFSTKTPPRSDEAFRCPSVGECGSRQTSGRVAQRRYMR
jgi:hypothetical protein